MWCFTENSMGPAGAKAISEALKVNTTLATLEIESLASVSHICSECIVQMCCDS